MYNIDVQNITFDFKNSDVESYNKIFETTSKLDISLLVNNVGANLGIRDFEKNSYDDIKDISVVNMLPVTLLSKHFASMCLCFYKKYFLKRINLL
jgi:short-subunit dehydrogenase